MASRKVRQQPGAKLGFYGYIVVIAATFITVVIFGVHYAFGVFFKPLLTDFGWTRAMTSGAFSLSWFLYGLSCIVAGRLTDRLGPRIVLTLCGLLLGIGYLLMSQISAVWQLYLFYGLIVGAGLGGGFVPLVSTVARWFVKRRNVMTGIVVAGMGIGTLVGPPVANWLISAYDWRVSYLILGSIILVVVILAAQFLRRDPSQMGQLPCGEIGGQEQRLKVGAEGFSLKEAVYTRQLRIVLAVYLCFGLCVYAILVHIVPHAIDLGISATSAANILASIGGASIVGRVVLGSAADRIGNRRVLVVSFILMSASLFWLVQATEAWMLYLFAVIFGLAYGGCATSESPLVAALFGLRSHGVILGVINSGLAIGATIGPIMAGYIFDVTRSYQLAFLVFAAIGVVGMILTLVLRPIRREIGKAIQ